MSAVMARATVTRLPGRRQAPARPAAASPRRPVGHDRARTIAPLDASQIPAHPAEQPVPAVPAAVLQRCGGTPCPSGGCDHHDERMVQRRSAGPAPGTASAGVPAAVHEVVRSPGQELPLAVRQLMEPRFGHDFRDVRVHADAAAAHAARAVSARAYTLGREVVFGDGQFVPDSAAGQRLIAHELAHVVQQRDGGGPVPRSPAGQAVPITLSSPGDPLERAADRAAQAAADGQRVGPLGRAGPSAAGRLHRTVGQLDCTAGVASAPADPRAELTDIDSKARSMAQQLGTDLAADAATVRGGIPDSPSLTLQSFIDHFGLPPAQGAGFLNRLTGTVRPSQEVATGEEIQILSRRFALVGRIFGDPLHYACGTGVVNVGACSDDCAAADGGDAFTCGGASGMGLCPSFWTGYPDNTARAAIAIHEMFHLIWFSGQGTIGDETLRGAGRNFDVAGCYEFIVDDIFGTNSGASCPPIP